jgi:hypothetical protein
MFNLFSLENKFLYFKIYIIIIQKLLFMFTNSIAKIKLLRLTFRLFTKLAAAYKGLRSIVPKVRDRRRQFSGMRRGSLRTLVRGDLAEWKPRRLCADA